MSLDTLVSLIGSLGFPVVCCGALFYQQNKTMKEFCTRIESAIASLQDSVVANTIATERLVTTVQIISKIEGSESK